MKIYLALLLVSVASASIAIPTFPTDFEAAVTVVEDRRSEQGFWLRSTELKKQRWDFGISQQQEMFVEIEDFNEGIRTTIRRDPQGDMSCVTSKLGQWEKFDFSAFSFEGQREFYRQNVDLWVYKNNATIVEYMNSAVNTSVPVQIGEKTPEGVYEGIFFNRININSVDPRHFNVSAIFSGKCTPQETVREFVRVPNNLGNRVWLNLSAPGNPGATVNWADNNWDCADVACTSRVPAGSAQPDYACAEFVARALCAGGYIQGVAPDSPQSEYASYNPGNGVYYDLLWVSSLGGGPQGLGDLLTGAGWDQSKSCGQAYAIIVLGYGHFVLGVDGDSVDSHNNARYHLGIDGYGGITQAFQGPIAEIFAK